MQEFSVVVDRATIHRSRNRPDNPELLILGAVPASNLTAMIQTGEAYKLITRATCPVLTLRESSCAGCWMRDDLGRTDTAIQYVEA